MRHALCDSLMLRRLHALQFCAAGITTDKAGDVLYGKWDAK